MRKIWLGIAIAIAALGIAAVAGASSTDKGRRLTPPVCIAAFHGSASVTWEGRTLGKVWDGVERSVGVGTKCRTYERRGLGVPIRTGGTGAGPIGPEGPAGKNGAAGTAGKDGQSVTLTNTNGCVTLHAVNGDGTVCNGHDGAAGAKGDKGDTGAASTVPGPAGPPGPPGPAGTDDGDGTFWLCWDGQTGHGTAAGGTGATPDCNNGTKAAIRLESVGGIVYLK